MPLTREQILAAQDLHREEVAVELWGGPVWVRRMRGDEFEAFAKESEGLADGDNPSILRWLALLLAHTVCDADGELLFSVADVDALMQKSPDAIGVVGEVACRVNRLGRYARERDDAGKS